MRFVNFQRVVDLLVICSLVLLKAFIGLSKYICMYVCGSENLAMVIKFTFLCPIELKFGTVVDLG